MLAIVYVGLRAHLWTRGEMRSRVGIALLHAAYIFLLVAVVYLYLFLSGGAGLHEARGVARARIAARWAGAWLLLLAFAHALIYLGQAEREQRRERQIAAGRVWTRADQLGHNVGAATVQQQVDSMTEDELADKVRPRLARACVRLEHTLQRGRLARQGHVHVCSEANVIIAGMWHCAVKRRIGVVGGGHDARARVAYEAVPSRLEPVGNCAQSGTCRCSAMHTRCRSANAAQAFRPRNPACRTSRRASGTFSGR